MEETSLDKNQNKSLPPCAIFGQHLYYSYAGATGFTHVLNGLNINVPKGKIYGLLGPSGCGKTTLLKCIIGRYRPTSGTIKVFGCIPGEMDSGIPGPDVGYMPQDLAVEDNMTIKEMIHYFGRLYFMSKGDIRRKRDDLISLLKLPAKNTMIGNLSSGQKRRVSFAVSVIHEPRLMILDEPTVGVDPLLRKIIWDRLTDYVGRGITIVVTTHYIEETRDADFVGFVRHGKLVAEDTPKHLMNQYSVDSLEKAFHALFMNKSAEKKTNACVACRSPVVKEIRKSFDKPAGIMAWITLFCTLIWKIMLQSRRNPAAMATQFVIPIISILIYLTCVGPIPMNLNLAVVNEEHPKDLSELYLKAVSEYKYTLKFVNYTNLEDAFSAAKNKSAFGVLHIRQNFTESLVDRIYDDDVSETAVNQSTITFFSDTTDKYLHVIIERFLEQSFLWFLENVKREVGGNTTIFDMLVVSQEQNEPDDGYYFSRMIYFYTIGVLFITTYCMAFATTILVVMAEKTGKIFDRNYAAGISIPQIILGHLVVRFLFAAALASVLFAQCIYLFETPLKGSFILSYGLLLLQALVGLCEGLMLSSLFGSFWHCATFSQGALLCMFVIGGVLWPVESLPYWISSVVKFSPINIPVEVLRRIMLNGWGLEHPLVWFAFLISGFWAVAFVILSILILKYFD